jgi:integrase
LKLDGESDKVRRAFTLPELKDLFEKAPTNFWKYMVRAGFYLGERMGDLICLKWGNFDFVTNRVRLTQSKTGNTVEKDLHPKFVEFLLALKPRNAKGADALFHEECAKYQRLGSGPFSNEFYDDVLLPCGLVAKRGHQKMKKADGEADTSNRRVSSVSFHCLRHTCVSFLKMTGASQAAAKELVGHSSDAISDHYTHMDGETLKRAIHALPGID